MGVDSYAELFTLILGWQFYNVVWDVLSSTGIVYLPFLGILIEHWRDAFVAGEDGNGAGQAVRAMEMELYIALTVVMLACVPTSLTPLNKTAVFYTPPATTANPTPTTVYGNASSSTFDTALGPSVPGTVNVPVWWYSVLALSAGIDSAIISGSNVSLDGLMNLAQASRMAQINDPAVRDELVRFYNECFVPARSLYLNNKLATAPVTAALTTYGASDPEWVGSHAFQDEPTLYASLYASREVAGWIFDPTRDADLAGASTLPTWGRPDCKQWWQDATIGLQAKLLAQAAGTSKLNTMVSAYGSSLTTAQQADLVTKVLVDNTRLSVSSTDSYTPTTNSGLSSEPSGMQAVGTYMTGAILYMMAWATTAVVRPALPFIQAVVLLGMALFLPFIMVMSRYSLSAMVMGAIAFFTVKFWSVMWYVADFLNDKFAQALYPDEYDLLKVLTNFFSFGDSAKNMSLSLVLLSLYVMLPLLWTGMMAMVGIKVGSAITQAKQTAVGGMGSAGSVAAGIAKLGLRGAGGGLKGVGRLLKGGRR